MTGTEYIPILHIYSTEDNESKEFLVNEKLLRVYYMDYDESKSINVDKCSTEGSKSKYVHKSVQKEKYAKNKHSTRNLWLRIIQFPRSRAILIYSNLVIIY